MERLEDNRDAWFLAILHNLPALAWAKDGEGRYVFVNNAAAEAFGRPESDIIGNTDFDIFPPSIAQGFRRNDELAAKKGSAVQTIEVLPDRDGIPRYSLVTKFPALAADGNVLICGTALDITDQRTAYAHQEFLFGISEKIRIATDADKLMEQTAETLGKFLGVDRCLFNEIDLGRDIETVRSEFSTGGKPVVGTHRISAYSSDTREQMQNGRTVVNRDSKADRRTSEFYDEVYGPAGERSYVAVPMLRDGRWVASLWCSSRKTRDWTEQETLLIETIAERTWSAVERLRSEKMLQGSRDTFLELIQSAPFGVYLVDSEFRLAQISAGSEKVFSNIDPLIGRDFGEILHIIWPEEFATRAIKIFRHTLETGEPFHANDTTEQRANEPVVESYDWQVKRVAMPDGSFGVVCYFYDLTDLRQAQESARRAAVANAFRLRLSDSLRRLSDPVEIQSAAAKLVGEELDADRVAYFEVTGIHYVVERDYTPDAADSLVGTYLIESFGESIIDSLRSARPVVSNDIASERELSDAEKGAFEAIKIAAHIAIPLVKQGELVAGLTVQSAQPREWTDEQVGLVEEAAERTWAAVERARAEGELRESRDLSQSVIDSIPSHMAVLDPNGVITLVNKAWEDFGRENSDVWPSEALGPGANYLTVCDQARGENTPDEDAIYEGIKAVLDGKLNSYSLEYPCDSPTAERWFLMTVYPLFGSGAVVSHQNITQRRRIEQEVRNTAERLTLAQKAGKVGIWDWNAATNQTYWSDEMWAIFGVEPRNEGPDGSFWQSRLYDEDKGRVTARVTELMAGPDTEFQNEYRIVRDDGEIRWIAVSATIERSAEGVPIRMYGVNIDITERKSIEEKIRASEEQLRLVADSLPALVSYIDRDLTYQFVNDRYTQWFGRPAEEIVGRTMTEILGETAVTSLRPHIDKVLDGEGVDFEAWLDYRGAGRRFVHVSYVPDLDLSGSVKGYYALVSDFTEQQRSEELLRSSEERMKVLTDSFSDYAILSTDQEGVVTSWNPGAKNIFGYTEDEIVGTSADRLFTPEDRAAGVPEEEMTKARKLGRASDERWHLRKDGSRFFANGVMAPLYSGETLMGYAKIATDLTEKRKQAELLQRAYEEMENRVLDRTQELAAANDSLVEQINERRSYERHRIELLQRIVTTQEAERKRIALDIHDHLGQRLTALRLKLASLGEVCGQNDALKDRVVRLQQIAELLDSEVSFLSWQLRPAALDELGLSHALETLVREWSRHYNKLADFHFEEIPDLRISPEVETQLYRITQEALNNVIKHAGASRVSVLLERIGNLLVLIVEDDGTGFDLDSLARAHEDKHGMGLPGMRERAELIGGELEVESILDSGTTIYLRVPLDASVSEGEAR
jgi:PAS domain S-box-containing protein